MISVAYAAGLVLAVTLVGLAVDWQRLLSHLRHLGRTPMSHRTDTVYGIGWRIVTDHRLEVSSTQVYPNGTTQIWLKRRPAA